MNNATYHGSVKKDELNRCAHILIIFKYLEKSKRWVDYINVNILSVIFYYSFTTCYLWGKPLKYMGFPCIISQNYM